MQIGWLTEKMFLLCGVRQGDPLSSLLYVQCVEALACLPRNSPEIKGFLLPGASGRQFKVPVYADDTTVILKDLSSLRFLFSLISVYERGSGAKLNKSKTEAMRLGSWRTRTDEHLGLSWVRKMKIFGVSSPLVLLYLITGNLGLKSYRKPLTYGNLALCLLLAKH